MSSIAEKAQAVAQQAKDDIDHMAQDVQQAGRDVASVADNVKGTAQEDLDRMKDDLDQVGRDVAAGADKVTGKAQAQVDDVRQKGEAMMAGVLTSLQGSKPREVQSPLLTAQRRKPSQVMKLEDRAFAMTLLPGGRIVIGGAPSGEILIINPQTSEVEFKLEGHLDSVLNLKVSGAFLYSTSADSSVRMWSIKSMRCRAVFEGHFGLVNAMWVMPSVSGCGLVTGGDDQYVKQWNTETAQCVTTFSDHEFPVNTVLASNTTAYSGDAGGHIRIFDLLKQEERRHFVAHRDAVWNMVFTKDLGLVTCGADSTIKIWSDPLEKSPRCLFVFTGHRGPVRHLTLHHPILFSAGRDGVIVAWDIEQGLKLEAFKMTDENGNLLERTIPNIALLNNCIHATSFNEYLNVIPVRDLLTEPQKQVELLPLEIEDDEEVRMEEGGKPKEHPRNKHEKILSMPPFEAVTKYSELPVFHVLSSLKYKVESSWLMSELIYFVPFLIMFMFFFISDYDTRALYFNVRGMEDYVEGNELPDLKLKKFFSDIDGQEDFSDWLTGVAVPSLWLGKGTSRWNDAVRAAGQQQLIGSMRIRTKRVGPHTCKYNSDIVNDTFLAENINNSDSWVLHQCYSTDPAREDTNPYACALNRCTVDDAAMLAEFNTTRFMYDTSTPRFRAERWYTKGAFVVEIPFILSEEDALKRIQVALDNGFVDDVATRLIVVEYHTYNPAINAFTSYRYGIELRHGGAWRTFPVVVPYQVYQLDEAKIVYECIFFCFVVYWIVHLYRSAKDFKKIHGKLAPFFAISWNLLEFVNDIIFVVMFGFRWKWFAESALFKLTIPWDITTYPTELDDMENDYEIQVLLNVVNTIFTFSKMLKYVRLNQNFNVLTRTLAAAQTNIVGVLILFLYFVAAFALTGNALYGNNIWEFRNLDASYNMLMRMLLGEMDYPLMSEINIPSTVVFFWAYQILASFIMLNFVIAVLGDAFSDVSASRLPISLDKAIVKAASEVRRSCLPKQLRITFVLISERKTRTKIMSDYVQKINTFIQSYLISVYGEDRYNTFDDDDKEEKLNDIYINSLVFQSLAGELCGRDDVNFLDQVWYDMAWEYHHKLLDKHEREKHESHESVVEQLSETFDMLRKQMARCGPWKEVMVAIKKKVRTARKK